MFLTKSNTKIILIFFLSIPALIVLLVIGLFLSNFYVIANSEEIEIISEVQWPILDVDFEMMKLTSNRDCKNDIAVYFSGTPEEVIGVVDALTQSGGYLEGLYFLSVCFRDRIGVEGKTWDSAIHFICKDCSFNFSERDDEKIKQLVECAWNIAFNRINPQEGY
jgi:hypothetical protein